MSLLHKRESRLFSVKRAKKFAMPERENKLCGFIEWIYKREKARISEGIITSSIH